MEERFLPKGFSIPCPYCSAKLLELMRDVHGCEVFKPGLLRYPDGRPVRGSDKVHMDCPTCEMHITDTKKYIRSNFKGWATK